MDIWLQILWLKIKFRCFSEDWESDVLVLLQLCFGWGSRQWGIRIKWSRQIERLMWAVYHGRKVSRWALQGPIVRVNP